jgi:hypothetical protein
MDPGNTGSPPVAEISSALGSASGPEWISISLPKYLFAVPETARQSAVGEVWMRSGYCCTIPDRSLR